MFNIVKTMRIMVELLLGLWTIPTPRSCVTIFGSARLTPDSQYYRDALKLAAILAPQYTVITGGGPGIMEAANRGAYEAGGISVGCSIELPMESCHNKYIHRHAKFRRFFIRKFIMTRKSDIIIVFPGGYGTLDELFEVLTVVQCRKQEKPVVIILYGRQYWSGLATWLRDTLCAAKTIDEEDLGLFRIADSVPETLAIIEQAFTKKAEKIIYQYQQGGQS